MAMKKIFTTQIKDFKTQTDLDDILQGLMILLMKKGIIQNEEEFLEILDSIKIAKKLEES